MATNILSLEDEISAALCDFAANLNAVSDGGGDPSRLADQARNIAYLLGDYRTLEGIDPAPERLAAGLRGSGK
jgi:hypothetical protein